MNIKSIFFAVTVSVSLAACAHSEAPSGDAALSKLTPEAAPIVIGQTYTISSSVLGTDRHLSVRLPYEYAAEPKRKFPVVYVIDGGPAQDFPHIAGIAQSREMNLTFEPFILVGVETVNRRYQITPPASDPKGYKKELGATPGGSSDFRKFLREDVMPWVNNNYRTNGQDAIMGESLAGLFIVETLLKDPALFDDYIAITPSLWWDEMKLAGEAPADLAAMPAGKRRLYLTMSDEGFLMQEGLDRLITALEAGAPDDLKWTYVERKNSESHASIYHVAALDAFRAFFLTAGRTGGANPYMYQDGDVPPLSIKTKVSFVKECTRERAEAVSFTEKNRDMKSWLGRCVLMKPGATATAGNLTY